MKHVFFFLAMMVISLLFAAAPSQTNPAIGASNTATGATPEPVALENALRDADLDFARQTAAHRLDGWMDFFADDFPSFTMARPSPARMHCALFTSLCLPIKISLSPGRPPTQSLPRMAR